MSDTLWICDDPSVGGARLVVDRSVWDRLDERARNQLRWCAWVARDAIAYSPEPDPTATAETAPGRATDSV